jgi:glucose/arabinose dehydrogenase
MKKRFITGISGALLLSLLHAVHAAENAPNREAAMHVDPVGQGPFYYDTAEGMDIRVRVVARGLNHPWSMALPPARS